MIKLVQLTANSWLMRAGSQSSGLVFHQDGAYVYMSPTQKFTFPDLEALAGKFGKIKFEELNLDEEVSQIRGYPVKHQGITIQSEDPPLYTKGGATVFAAGYWGLKFTGGWTQAFCPKQETCEKYQSIGPFRNRLEMLNSLTTLNSADNLKAIV
jgi:hypothetical protein